MRSNPKMDPLEKSHAAKEIRQSEKMREHCPKGGLISATKNPQSCPRMNQLWANGAGIGMQPYESRQFTERVVDEHGIGIQK